jgi:hypothetical protein
MDVDLDASQVFALAAQLEQAHMETVRSVQAVVQKGALNVKNGWRDRARTTAGKHGKLYPLSISYQMIAWGTAEIGPEAGKPQGRMSFELGSVKQPPHLDGQQAADDEAPRFHAAIELLTRELEARL